MLQCQVGAPEGKDGRIRKQKQKNVGGLVGTVRKAIRISIGG